MEILTNCEVQEKYEVQALDFLKATNTEMTVEFIENGKHFDDDKHNRDIYKVTFKRGNRKFSVRYGQSLINSAKIVDTVTGNEYTTDGGSLKGNTRITDMERYRSSLGRQLKDVKGTPPTAYDVLTCLEKYGYEDFEEFCSESGYDTNNSRAKKIFKAVQKEYDNVCKLWSDEEIEQLREIQ